MAEQSNAIVPTPTMTSEDSVQDSDATGFLNGFLVFNKKTGAPKLMRSDNTRLLALHSQRTPYTSEHLSERLAGVIDLESPFSFMPKNREEFSVDELALAYEFTRAFHDFHFISLDDNGGDFSALHISRRIAWSSRSDSDDSLANREDLNQTTCVFRFRWGVGWDAIDFDRNGEPVPYMHMGKDMPFRDVDVLIEKMRLANMIIGDEKTYPGSKLTEEESRTIMVKDLPFWSALTIEHGWKMSLFPKIQQIMHGPPDIHIGCGAFAVYALRRNGTFSSGLLNSPDYSFVESRCEDERSVYYEGVGELAMWCIKNVPERKGQPIPPEQYAKAWTQGIREIEAEKAAIKKIGGTSREEDEK